jgi:mono/diheme cytochrome c family protein
MQKHNLLVISIFLLALLVASLLASCGTSNTSEASSGATDGQSLMQDRCSVCHSTSRITSAHKTSADWTTTVQRMVIKGAQLNSQEQQTLIDYLAANFK